MSKVLTSKFSEIVT